MKTRRLPCGCHFFVGERELWTQMCATHEAEHAEIHARWAAERRANPPPARQDRTLPTNPNTIRLGGTP
jgi:hypothetical protein